jgi:hypothetical protein
VSLHALADSANRLKTRMGKAFVGTRAVFRGHDLHAELRHMDWLELHVFGITGRRFNADQLRLLNAMWVCTSYPDARLWNNRVAALAASARSTPSLGISAALAVSEAMIYGGHPFVRAMEFIQRAQGLAEQGSALEDIAEQELRQRRIYGFGRPIASADERLPWLIGIAESLGLASGPHLRLALELERILVRRHPKLRMNYAALMAALAADLGFSTREFQHFQVPVFMAGMAPCFIEAAERPPGALFPLSCSHVAYEGVAKRRWCSGASAVPARQTSSHTQFQT